MERPARASRQRAGRPRLGVTPSVRVGVEKIAEAAHGLDDVDAELLAQAADEHLDGVRIPVEILVVEVLGQFAPRDDAAGMVHQIGRAAGIRAR